MYTILSTVMWFEWNSPYFILGLYWDLGVVYEEPDIWTADCPTNCTSLITQYGSTVYIGIAMVYPRWKPYIRILFIFTFNLKLIYDRLGHRHAMYINIPLFHLVFTLCIFAERLMQPCFCWSPHIGIMYVHAHINWKFSRDAACRCFLYWVRAGVRACRGSPIVKITCAIGNV